MTTVRLSRRPRCYLNLESSRCAWQTRDVSESREEAEVATFDDYFGACSETKSTRHGQYTSDVLAIDSHGIPGLLSRLARRVQQSCFERLYLVWSLSRIPLRGWLGLQDCL